MGQKSGIRAVFLHGTPGRAPDVPHPLAEIDRLLDGPVRAHELLTVGMAVAAPQHSTSDVAVADLRAADERDLVPSTHQSGGQLAAAWEAVRSAGLFGPRTNIVPGAGLSDEWVDRLVSVGVSFTSTPEKNLAMAIARRSPEDCSTSVRHHHWAAGRWRKRDHSLVDTDLEEVKSELLESGERLVRKLNAIAR